MGRDSTSHKLWFGHGWAGDSITNGQERGISTPMEETKLGPVHRHGQRGGPAPGSTAQKDAHCTTLCLRSS